MTQTAVPLFLVDAYGLIYRAYFAFLSRPLRDNQGRNVSALYGFLRSLFSLLEEGAGSILPLQPRLLATVFDSRIKTFRHDLYPDYKATRQKTPDELHAQVPLVESVLETLGVPILRLDGYEADDIIATLAERCRSEKRPCYIISSDKDLLQLVGEGIFQLRPGKAKGPYELIGPAEVAAEWGVESHQMLDLLALTGDASDNVPGVRGIGDKSAAKLLARFGSLDEIYRNLALIEGALGKKLAEGRDKAFFSRSLIKLKTELPLDTGSLDNLSVEKLNRQAAADRLLGYGIRSLAASLTKDRPPAPALSRPATEPGAQGLLFSEIAELRVNGTYRVLNSLAELDEVLTRARAKGCLALDFETDSLEAWQARPIGLALAVTVGEAFYAPLVSHPLSADPAAPEAAFLEPAAVRQRLAAICSDPDMTIVAHNAKYDYEVSRAWGLTRWQCRIWDTMVAAWLVDETERSSYRLEALVRTKLDLPMTAYEAVVPKGQTFQNVPLASAVCYAAEDADYALRLKELAASGQQSLFNDLEMPLLPILAEMEGTGILIDSASLAAYSSELSARLAEIEQQIYQLVGHEFNIASPKQLQQVLFIERRLKTGKKTKTGFSTDVEVLEELAREDPVPAEILRYRQLAKLKSTYVDALPLLADAEGRVHSHFSQTGTVTGRLSSRDPNLQNIPVRDQEGRRIRRAFQAGPGRLLLSADYSQIELVVLAHLSQDPALCAAFHSGQDVHRQTAALIFGVAESTVNPEQRRIAKTINFGVMYGMSAFRLANELKIPRTAAQEFIEVYFRTYAGVQAFIEGLIKQAEDTGYAKTLLGRRRPLPTIKSANRTEKAAAERVAVNTPIQGSAADIVKLAMLRIDAALPALPSARLLLQVHDELIFECDQAEVEALAALVTQAMSKAVQLSVPLRAAVTIGKNWGDLA